MTETHAGTKTALQIGEELEQVKAQIGELKRRRGDLSKQLAAVQSKLEQSRLDRGRSLLSGGRPKPLDSIEREAQDIGFQIEALTREIGRLAVDAGEIEARRLTAIAAEVEAEHHRAQAHAGECANRLLLAQAEHNRAEAECSNIFPRMFDALEASMAFPNRTDGRGKADYIKALVGDVGEVDAPKNYQD